MSPLTVPPKGPLLVASPHSDDAALSCSVLLDRSEPVDVLTVFSGLPEPPLQGEWDKLTGFPGSAESIAARREEDRVAFAGSGHRLHYLDLLQHQHSPDGRPPSDRLAIASAISGWVDQVGSGVVAVPAGAGRRVGRMRTWTETLIGHAGGSPAHPDHLLVRDSALEMLDHRPTFAVLLYEELPYALDGAADGEVSSVASKAGRKAVRYSVEIDRQSKARRIKAYRSQVPHLWGGAGRLDDPDSLPPLEKYWYLESREA